MKDFFPIKKKFSRSEYNRLMDVLRFYVLFNSMSVISGQWADENERLCAMKLRLRLRRFRSGLELELLD